MQWKLKELSKYLLCKEHLLKVFVKIKGLKCDACSVSLLGTDILLISSSVFIFIPNLSYVLDGYLTITLITKNTRKPNKQLPLNAKCVHRRE